MRIIIDQQLPPLLAGWFRDQGLDAAHVRELGMSSAPDADIWAEATTDNAVVISRDEGFVARVRSGGARLVWIRIGNCANPTLLAVIADNWPRIHEKLQAGERLVELRA